MPSKKIFLDVGGNNGQSIKEVLKSSYHFDVIHVFEPQPECCEAIKQKYGDYPSSRLIIHQFGLADFDGEKNLYGEGIGASLFADKRDIDNSKLAKCRFVSASKFFDENINKNDLVFMKLNCEGGEALILRDLISSGKIHLLSNVMIDFDIRKIPSQQHLQKHIISQLADAGFKKISFRKQVMIGTTHQKSIRWWLANLGNSTEFMDLTTGEKVMRLLPMWLRWRVQKKYKRYYRKFYRLIGRERDYYND